MRRFIAVLVPVAVIALVGAIAVMSASERAAPRGTLGEVAGRIALQGVPLPPLPADVQPGFFTDTPLLSPTVTAEDRAGTLVTLGAGSDSTQVLVFLAHWCPACQKELPSLAEVVNRSGVPEGVEVIAVLTGLDPSRPNWPPYEWLDREGFRSGSSGAGSVRVVRDDADGSAMSAFGLSSYPAWAVISPEGAVASRFSGVIDRSGIEALLEGAARLG